MGFEPFAMERWQSLHEHEVEINLSDSGVEPISVRELVEDDEERAAILDEPLIYIQTDGTPELRGAIAELHPGAAPENVEVVNGGAEANFLVAWTLIEPGDEVVVMLPNYMQLPGLFANLDARVREWWLAPDLEHGRWTLDLDELERLVTDRTRLIVLCNPNNPTGVRLGGKTLDAIGRIADRHGAWVLCDEIYRGCELDGHETPTIWGRCERAIVTSSLSKTYGLPGLRLGWIVAPRELIASCWARHDYTTIAPAALSDRLARIALEPARRARLVSRAREILTRNYAACAGWLADQRGTLDHVPPEAGAMLLLRYEQDARSTTLAERLRTDASVLVVPGEHFEMDRWLRVGYGGDTDTLLRGLERIGQLCAVPI